jgi:Metallo-peptidase family M12B Reprolysin-like
METLNKEHGMAKSDPFKQRDPDDAAKAIESEVHIYGPNAVCETDIRGHAQPRNRPPTEIVVDASEGFVPLWVKGATLRWRFQEHSMAVFEDPDAAKAAIKGLFDESLLAWGDAAPVTFDQADEVWDFEIVMRPSDRCTANGCVLASAFFPDAGRHELVIYPKLFTQSIEEQVETLVHELGHVFGLRHFFANISEGSWPSEIFGTHKPLSIMNYGHQSQLTADDRDDLTRLYQSVWAGELADINLTPIRLQTPFNAARVPPG